MADESSSEYGWETHEPPHSCSYLVDTVKAVLARLEIGSVVDVGCGNGALCGELAAAGYRVAGTEYDAEGCAIASTNHPEVAFFNLGVQDDPSGIVHDFGRFDAVVSTEVIEHLFSPRLLPVFARQLLVPGGYLIVSTPYHGYLKNLAISLLSKWDTHWNVFWDGGHIKFFSHRSLSLLLRQQGFAELEFIGVGRIPLLWKSMIIVARRVDGANHTDSP